jgi:hypothetical protein
MRDRLQGLAFVAVLAGSFAVAAPVWAQQVPGEPTPQIVNGLPSNDWPSVASLIGRSTGRVVCTATLIGCSTALTAAHCVCEGGGPGPACPDGTHEIDPADYVLFLQHDEFLDIGSIEVHPSYAFGVRSDVALLVLSESTNGIRPSEINATQEVPFGTTGTLVGFGVTDGNGSDSGIKRVGTVTTGSCAGAGVPESTHVCWTFDDPIGPPGDDSNTCFGDSGGPLFADLGSGLEVAGVTSGGLASDCQPLDESFDADVYEDRTWMLDTGGADLGNPTCGTLPQVGDPGTTVFSFDGQLSAAAPEAFHSFAVPAGTQVLRVSLNGEDGVSNDFDLYVRQGAPPTTSVFDCRSAFAGNPEFCEIASPQAGTWHVMARRFSGAGAYQVTATMFAAAALPALGPRGLALAAAAILLGGMAFVTRWTAS